MSHSTAQPGLPAAQQPTPVLDKAQTVGTVLGFIPVVVAICAALGLNITVDEQVVALVAGGIVGAINYALPILAARRATQLVTPVASPRDDAGRELVPLDHIDRGLAGEVGAAAADWPGPNV